MRRPDIYGTFRELGKRLLVFLEARDGRRFSRQSGRGEISSRADVDVYLIADLPDSESAASASLAVGHSGVVTEGSLTLLTLEEMDKASKNAVESRPAGR